MASRTIVVPADSPLLRDRTTEKLHTYPDGQVLIRTAAPAEEARGSGELEVRQGLQLSNVSTEELAQARATSFAAFTAEAADEANSGKAESGAVGYVEFIGPIDGEWLRQLRELNIEPLRYHPENTYLCHANDVMSLLAASRLPVVLQVTPLTGSMKPKVDVPDDGEVDVVVVADAYQTDEADVITSLQTVPGVRVTSHEPERIDFTVRVCASVTTEGLDALLRHPRVLAVEAFEQPEPDDEVAGLIIAGQYDLKGKPSGSYLRWLEDHGLNGDGVTIAIVDSGVDAAHPAFQGRIRDLSDGRKSWHGTFVAGHAAGCYLDEKDGSNYIYGVGVAPAANLLIQNNTSPAVAACRQSVTEKAPSGIVATIQNNSWGKGLRNPMDYGSEEAAYDKLVRNADPGGPAPRPLMICFSSGNSGVQGLTRPKSAKNILVTGNSENYRPDVGHDQSDNISELFAGPHASSIGNLGDGRICPHIVAPGEWTASAGYDVRAGDPEFISSRLTWGGGSSGASPKTAAACALLTQWWRKRNSGYDPSPAMLRALIINGAVPLTSAGPVPNNRQGWGRLNVDNILNEQVPHLYVDQTMLLTRFGEKRAWNLRVGDPLQPVKITLAWTDPSGPVGSGGTPAVSPIVNRLALRAEVDGQLYRANEFRNSWSVLSTDAASEGADNLQNIFLSAGLAKGSFRVSVTALNLTMNCFTSIPDTPQQDFALVITNARMDAVTTSADIAVVTDPNAKNTTAPLEPEDYWKAGGRNNDSQELNAGWWKRIEPPSSGNSGPVPARMPEPGKPDRKQQEYSWWTAVNLAWSGSGTGPKPSAETDRRSAGNGIGDLARSVETGLGLAVARGHRAQDAALQAEASRHDSAPDNAGDSISFLSNIATALNQPACSGQTGQVRRKAAVVVVGSGTRVSVADIDQMRQLAFSGDLYVISDDSRLLAFLAQRIHLQQGVHLRLARGEAELPQLVRDTLAEASGMHQVVISANSEMTASGLKTQYAFYVVNHDLQIVLNLSHTQDATVESLVLQPPGREPITVLPGQNSEPQIQMTLTPELVHLALDRSGFSGAWAGLWRAEVIQGAERLEYAAVLEGWAANQLDLSARPQEVSSEATRESDTAVLLTLSGAPGVTFSRAVIAPSRGSGTGERHNETERETVLIPTTSRLTRHRGRGEAGAPTLALAGSAVEAAAPTLSTVVPFQYPGLGARIVDIPVRVTGKDATGNQFERSLRTSLVTLEPRSEWRTRISAVADALFVSATIENIRYEQGEVIGLRLTKNGLSREVAVRNTNLRTQLPQLGLARAKNREFLFGVSADEVTAVCRLIDGQRFTADDIAVSDDRGIDDPAPAKTSTPSGTQETDYPFATRFIPAAAFRHATRRNIRRIVIHITDGNAQTETVLRWFQKSATGVSAHYLVGQDGEVVQMVRDYDMALHARRANADSIGIEHCARSEGALPGQPAVYPSLDQYSASAALVRWLCDQYRIPIDRDHILGHSEVDSKTTHANCPNSVWDWEYYMGLVLNQASQSQSA